MGWLLSCWVVVEVLPVPSFPSFVTVSVWVDCWVVVEVLPVPSFPYFTILSVWVDCCFTVEVLPVPSFPIFLLRFCGVYHQIYLSIPSKSAGAIVQGLCGWLLPHPPSSSFTIRHHHRTFHPILPVLPIWFTCGAGFHTSPVTFPKQV